MLLTQQAKTCNMNIYTFDTFKVYTLEIPTS